jgi:hypothetical protein
MLVLKIEAMSCSDNLPNRAELESAVRGWIDDCVWRQEIKRAETGGLDFFECDEIEKMGRTDASELDGLFRFASSFFVPQEKAAIGRVLTGNASDEKYRPIITEAARQIGVSIEGNTPAGRLVERTILRGYATLLDELRQTISTIPRVATVEKKPTKPSTFIFTEFWADFAQHKRDNREWKPDTAANAKGTKNIFDKLCPGTTIAQLMSTPIASDFKSKLLLLLRNYSRGKRAKTSSAKLLALGRTLPTQEKVQSATVNKHVGNLEEYWSYLVTQKKIPADIQKPFLRTSHPPEEGPQGSKRTLQLVSYT